jgi:hypothetical protein
MKVLAIGMLSLLVAACSSKSALRCDGRLTPINPPAKVQGATPRGATTSPGHDATSSGSRL